MVLPLLACAASASPADPDYAHAPPPPTAITPQHPLPAPQESTLSTAPAAAFDAIHAPWTAILQRRVKGGDFDYAGIAKERAPLDAYVAALEAVKPDAVAALSAREQFAFWINVYNAYTVKHVVDGWPVKSIRDLGDEKVSIWDRELVPLGRLAPKLMRERLTLNDVEHKILRPGFGDARLHAAVNCASKGCPALRAEAFVAAKLDAQLDEQVKLWLADASRNRFDRDGRRIEVSKVFEWFAEDFRKESGSVPAWIARFRPDDRDWLTGAQKPEVKYQEYDWAINAVRN
jgi:hypothetical protein